jgi:hypothetical protein
MFKGFFFQKIENVRPIKKNHDIATYEKKNFNQINVRPIRVAGGHWYYWD